MMNLKDFIASDQEQGLVNAEFKSYRFVLDFTNSEPDYLCQIPAVMGVYFIAGSRAGKVLKAYVGQTSNFRKRLGDYHRGFQVHCPNDWKMSFFQDWLAAKDPGWELHMRMADDPFRLIGLLPIH